MSDSDYLTMFGQAWGGLKFAVGGGSGQVLRKPDQLERVRYCYLRRLRQSRTGPAARRVLAELLAEGGIPTGGIELLKVESNLASFVKEWDSSDGWQRVRNLALLAADQDPPGPGQVDAS
jgi:hypothetical protein